MKSRPLRGESDGICSREFRGPGGVRGAASLGENAEMGTRGGQRKVDGPYEPKQTFGGGMLFSLQLVNDEQLESF